MLCACVLKTPAPGNVPPSFSSLSLLFAIILVLTKTMNTRPTSQRDSHSSDSESSYFIGSYNSATETDSDIPGPGRLLGKAYGYLGKKVETSFSTAAMKFGLGPRATAVKIRRLVREGPPLRPASRKKLEKTGKQLVKYVR